jgi:hypothetical protein
MSTINPAVAGFNYMRQIKQQEADNQQTNLENQRRNEAANYLSQQYGPAAGDPVAYGQLEGIERGKRNEERDVQTTQQAQAEAERQRRLTGTRTALQLAQRGVQAGIAPADIFARIPEATRQDLGIDDGFTAAVTQDPTMLDTLGRVLDPQDAMELRTGTGPDGKPAFFTFDSSAPEDQQVRIIGGATPTVSGGGGTGNRAALRVVGSTLFDPYTGEVVADLSGSLEEGARATSRGREVGKVEGTAAGKGDQFAVNMEMILDRNIRALQAATEGGAIVSAEDPNFLSRTLTGLSGTEPGRFLAGITGDPKEVLRENVDAAASSMRELFIQNPDITSRMFDTPAEQQALLAQLEGGRTLESKLSALNETARRFRVLYGQPQGGAPATAAPSQPGAGDVISWDQFIAEGN